MSKKISINDIAKEAGVAKATVSNVINNKPHVSPKIRKKVQDVIDKYHYTKSFFADSLSKKAITKIIGLEIGADETQFLTFFPDLISSVLMNASEYGYRVLIFYGLNQEDTRTLFKQGNAPIDGLICINPELGDSVLSDLQEHHVPCVSIGRVDNNFPLFAYVDVDNYSLARELVSQFVLNGKKRICLFNSLKNMTISKYREEALNDINKHSDSMNKVVYYPYNNDIYGETLKALNDGCNAFLISENKLAKDVYKAIKDRNLIIGQDILVAGLGYSYEKKSSFKPHITYGEQNYKALGKWAVKLLIQLIKGNQVNNKIVQSTIHYQQSLKKCGK